MLEAVVYLKSCKHTAKKCKQIFENWKNPPPLKHILALPTWGQKCLVSEIEQIEKVNFDLGHPVFVASGIPYLDVSLGHWLVIICTFNGYI